MEVEHMTSASAEQGTATLSTSVKQVDLQTCDDTQVGNLRVHHGDITVRHVMEISGSGENPTSTLQPPVVPSIHDEFLAFGNQISQQYGSINRAFQDWEIHGEQFQPQQRTPLLNNNKKLDGKKIYWRCICIILVIFILTLVITLTILYGHIKRDSNNLPPNFTHIYRERAQWYALQPKAVVSLFSYLPPKFVVVSDTGTPPCNTEKECSENIRNVQAAQMSGMLDDIAYNFLVAGNGLIYEGRGWKLRSASTPGMGCSALAVAFVGNFSKVQPPKQQLEAFSTLLDTAENYGKLDKNYKMFMQSDVTSIGTIPGKTLLDLLHQWPHSTVFGPKYLLCNNI